MTISPAIVPPLDPGFLPACIWNRYFEEQLVAAPSIRDCEWVFQRPGGQGFWRTIRLLPDTPEYWALNYKHLERTLKFLLWQKGANSVIVAGEPGSEVARLREAYREGGKRAFDRWFFGEKVYPGGFDIQARQGSAAIEFEETSVRLGGNWNGCRIGFDLGGSDRKVAAVIDGEVVFSEEVRWDPYYQPDIRYHFEGIQDALRRAAQHLPRVDAIGGSAAGVYVDNEPRLGSLYRGISEERFDRDVKPLFQRIRAAWNDVPMTVVNDGAVSAIAGAQSLGETGVLGLSFGTSMAGGFVGPDGGIAPWLNELAFVPVDYRDDAPVDEWSGDIGCGVQYFSQQAIARLIPAAGIELPDDMPVPEKLVRVQELMLVGDTRAARIYETIGVYLGYAAADFADYYDLRHVLLLGRVMSGDGGRIIIEQARRVLEAEFPELRRMPRFHQPDEKQKRLGQAVVAASLPSL